jgi:phage portal protein BeeE
LPIWARHSSGELEKVDRDSEHLLQEYRRRFAALSPVSASSGESVSLERAVGLTAVSACVSLIAASIASMRWPSRDGHEVART